MAHPTEEAAVRLTGIYESILASGADNAASADCGLPLVTFGPVGRFSSSPENAL
jgi:hypothetical protein